MADALIGKCGIYCGACPTFLAGNCEGCTAEHQTGDCYSLDCATRRGLDFCGACAEFPCTTILTQPRTTALDKDWLEWKKRSNTNR